MKRIWYDMICNWVCKQYNIQCTCNSVIKNTYCSSQESSTECGQPDPALYLCHWFVWWWTPAENIWKTKFSNTVQSVVSTLYSLWVLVHITQVIFALTSSCINATKNAILSSFLTELRVFIVLWGPVNKKYKLFQSSQNAQDDYTQQFSLVTETQKIIEPLSCYTITFVARCIHVFYAQKTTVQTIANRDRDLPKSDICSSVSLIRLFYIYKLKIVCRTLH